MQPPVTHTRRKLTAFAAAAAACVPGLVLKLTGTHPHELVAAAVFGAAIVGAAFLLAWAAEALELDLASGLTLAVVALIAVLPEYAVDFAFTYKAGSNPDKYAGLALANMTGANRLLIGVGWPMVVLLAAWRIRRIARTRGYEGEVETGVTLDRPHSIEITFLAIATLYSLTLALKTRLTLVDAAVLLGIYVVYLIRTAGAPPEEPELIGPAQLLGELPTVRRRWTVAGILSFAAFTIVMCAEPFAESLVDTGKELGISTFLLVQWLAPLASEAPELLIAGLFAWRLNTNSGLGILVSSKVNQWTLLVGTLPLVFIIGGGVTSGLPLGSLQREELFLTAAQSAFAVAVLASRSISVREAWALMALFACQFVLGGILPTDARHWQRIGVGILYLVLAAGMLILQSASFRRLVRDGLRTPVRELVHENDA